MVMLVSERTAAMTKRLRAQAQLTKHQRYLDQTYVLYRLARETATWDIGLSDERHDVVVSGKCKLYSNGVGGPRLGDVIYPESPYRLRVLASEVVNVDGSVPNVLGLIMVVDGARVFVVDDIKIDDADDLLADVFMSERPGADLPTVGV